MLNKFVRQVLGPSSFPRIKGQDMPSAETTAQPKPARPSKEASQEAVYAAEAISVKHKPVPPTKKVP